MIALSIVKFDKGTVRVRGRLVTMISTDTLLYMERHLSERIGNEEAAQFIYECGLHQTKTGAKRYLQEKGELSRLYQRVPVTGDASMEMGWEVLKLAGWGDTRLGEFIGKGEKAIANTKNSPTAEAYLAEYGKSDRPVCHYLRGLIAGVAESVSGQDYSAVETSCKATGISQECVFELKRIGKKRKS